MNKYYQLLLFLCIGLIGGILLGQYVDFPTGLVIIFPFIIALNYLIWLTRQKKTGPEHGLEQEEAIAQRVEQAVRQERERIYRNLHDDIGAQLLNLVYNAPDPQAADLARVALQNMREAIAKTVDKKLSLPELLGDIRAEMENRLASTDIQLQWQVDADLTEHPLKAQQVIAISRIFRECLSNTLKHAQANTITFSAAAKASRLMLSFSDNGIGAAKVKRGRGLGSMAERASRIGAQLSTDNLKSGGFRVRLSLSA